MTVIAWDGKTLAADKRSLNNGRPSTVTKLFRLRGGALAAISGDFARGLELLKWLEAGADPATLPAFQRTNEDYVPMLVVKLDGLWMFEQAAVPFLIEEPFFAMGSGRDFALAALHLGKTAAEAVAVANALCTSCGNGIDTLTFDQPAATPR